MIFAYTSGFNTSQSNVSDLVTVTKSLPKKTPVTPSIWKSFFANGERIDSRALEKFIDEDDVDVSPSSPPSTGFPGRNISEDGFGVDWVWMNIALLCVFAAIDVVRKREENGGALLHDEEPSIDVDKARAKLSRSAFLPPPPSEEKKSAEDEEEEEDADSEDNRLKTEEE